MGVSIASADFDLGVQIEKATKSSPYKLEQGVPNSTGFVQEQTGNADRQIHRVKYRRAMKRGAKVLVLWVLYILDPCQKHEDAALFSSFAFESIRVPKR